MIWRARGSRLGFLALWSVPWVACANSKFAVSEDNDAGPGGTAGAGRGGSAGKLDAGKDSAAARGGTGGVGGSAGSGGGAGCAPACTAGQYCNVSSGKCSPCNDLSRFNFAAPEPITPRAGSLRFPRLTSRPNEMLFRVGDEGALQSLYVTSNPSAAGSEQAFGSPVNVVTESASGALEVSLGAGDLPNFFFDRSTGGVNGPRQLYFARRISGLTFAARDAGPAADPLPAPFNSTGSNYSIAIAVGAARAWWMSTRTSSAAELLTAPLNQTTPNPAQAIDIVLGGTNSCSRAAADSTPWAAPDGRFLLMSALEVNNSCSPLGSARDLYIVVTKADGTAEFSAPLQDINHGGIDDADPSMSADLCWLYFASNPSGSASGFRLYRALRH